MKTARQLALGRKLLDEFRKSTGKRLGSCVLELAKRRALNSASTGNRMGPSPHQVANVYPEGGSAGDAPRCSRGSSPNVLEIIKAVVVFAVIFHAWMAVWFVGVVLLVLLTLVLLWLHTTFNYDLRFWVCFGVCCGWSFLWCWYCSKSKCERTVKKMFRVLDGNVFLMLALLTAEAASAFCFHRLCRSEVADDVMITLLRWLR